MISRIINMLLVLSSIFALPYRPIQSGQKPSIENFQVLTPTLAAFDPFQARFDLKTIATHLSLPFDAHLPKGLEKISGISVDAVFSSPGGQQILQPAFLYQPVQITAVDGIDHDLPVGKPYWMVRFTPQVAGKWDLRLRATDAGGTVLYPPAAPITFTVSGLSQNTYRSRGFLRTSTRDTRYFEFQNGTPFIGTGFNTGIDSVSKIQAQFENYEKNRVNLLRIWMSGDGINGSQWTPWASFHLSYDGYLPGTSLETRDTFPGHDTAFLLDDSNPCLFQGWQGGLVPVEPNKTYTVWSRVKVKNVGKEGFVIKTGGWLEKKCSQAGQGIALTQPLSGSTGWTELTATFQTKPGQSWLDNLFLARQGTTGTALVDEVRVYLSDDPDRTNILRQPSPDSHLSFDPIGSARWDAIIASAETQGIYLKVVIDEKNEWIRNHIDASGNFVDKGDNNNFYASPGTKVRWLEQAWWRYIIARWGYSTAVHSFEYVNEGDPYNGNHYEAANTMAQFFHQNDPSRHMVTTSFWHSFPNIEFWSNPLYKDIDYVDLHAYVSTGWPDGRASFISKFPLDTDPTNRFGSAASVRIDRTKWVSDSFTPGGIVLAEKGEWIIRYWMKAKNFQAICLLGGSGGMQRVRWSLDESTKSQGKEGVVPPPPDGETLACTSPGGSYAWSQFRSDRDWNGKLVQESSRLILTDQNPHELMLSIENYSSFAGTAWISDVELVSPSGKVVPVIGQFDPTSMEEDSAWYNAAYGLVFGGASPVGAHKPLIRGEGAINQAGQDGYNPDLNLDKQGVWLHNNLWAQLGPGGIPDLPWWAGETIEENTQTGRIPGLLGVYLPFQKFMDGIPINNGLYQDAAAQTSNPQIRAWGQRDDTNGRAHLWIQNQLHTWRAVVDGKPIPAASGSITLKGLRDGPYKVEWWDTHLVQNQVIQTQMITVHQGVLVLNPPEPVKADIAAKIERQ